MGAIVFAVFFMLGLTVVTPVYAILDWYFSYRPKGETFKEYLEKF